VKIQLGVEAPSDVERVAKAFGKKLGLDGPATVDDIEEDLKKYVQGVVQQQEQAALYDAANRAAQKIPPVGIDVEPEPAA
jgi:hypothetical protein